jgi:AcrR family transcriptional regulator
MSETAVASAPRRRRDRKAEIAAAAAPLFCQFGYHRVGIDDVGEAVGITGGAIYRHFANKGELLARTLRDGLELVSATVTDPSRDDPARHLDEVCDRLAGLALENRGFGILLQREVRHLADDDRVELLGRLAATTNRFAELIAAVRPELEGTDAWLLARSVLSAGASPSFHSVPLGRHQSQALLLEVARALLCTSALPAPAARRARPAEPLTGGPRRSSRREVLLEAAIQLFGSRGYWAVRMEDVGAAAGITGPSIYQHFPGKADLLVAALNRGAQWLDLGMSRALGSSATPSEALGQIVDSYVRFVLEHPDLLSLLLTESVYLPADARHALRRTQHDYVGEWATLLVEVRPELGEHEALFLTHGVLAMINDGARSDRVRTGWDAEWVLGQLGRQVLLGSAA